jgi:lipoprotein-releasing system permease protein
VWLPWLALRGMWSSRGLLLVIVAVALGAGIQMSNAANLAGFEAALLDDVLAHGRGDIRITPRDRSRFTQAEADAAVAQSASHEAVYLLVYPGGVAGSNRRFLPASVIGVDRSASRPPYRLVAGAPLAEAGDHGVLLGTGLAVRLGVTIGDPIELRAVLGPRDALLGLPNTVELSGVVRGIVSGTSGSYRAVFVDRAVLGAAAGATGAVSLIALHTGRPHDAASDAASLAAGHPELEVRSWRDHDPGVAAYLEIRDTIGTISYLIVIAAVAIPMWTLLYIHVLRRQRELAILRAVGLSRGELFAICTLQSVVIAIVGCALGAGVGLLLTHYFSAHPILQVESLIVVPLLDARMFLVPFVVILVTSIVAAIHPSLRAARVAPAVVLRRIE